MPAIQSDYETKAGVRAEVRPSTAPKTPPTPRLPRASLSSKRSSSPSPSSAPLASLLFPTLIGTKERARRANCVNNIRQFSLALHLYSNDSSGSLPPGYSDLVEWMEPRLLISHDAEWNSVCGIRIFIHPRQKRRGYVLPRRIPFPGSRKKGELL